MGFETVQPLLGERGRPPMEESDVTDAGRIVLKGKTALSLHLLQLIQCLEAAIGNPLI